ELYTPGMFIMVGALAIGFVANLLVRPVKDKYLEPTTAEAAPTSPSTAEKD
ncbi:MFS transporter, partial [Burkholderia multivorans]